MRLSYIDFRYSETCVNSWWVFKVKTDAPLPKTTMLAVAIQEKKLKKSVMARKKLKLKILGIMRLS